MEPLRWTAASRKHGIQRHQVREVLNDESTLVVEVRPPVPGHDDERITVVGPDGAGNLLEIALVELNDGKHELLVIHAMPARQRLAELYRKENP